MNADHRLTDRRYRSPIARLPIFLAALVVAIGSLPRLALAAGVLPDALHPFIWSDVLFIWERGARDGQLPYRDVFFEYPPLVGYLWAAIESVAPSAVAHLLLWTVLQSAAAGIVAAVLTRQAGRAPTLLFWSLSPQLLLYGALNFDVLAVAAMVGAIALAARGREVVAAASLAVGTAAKLFPAALLPLMLARSVRAGDRRGAVVAAAAFAALLALAYAPGAGARYSTLGSIGRYSLAVEPNIDSVGGLVRALLLRSGQDAAGAIVAVSLIGTVATYVLLVLPAARRSAGFAAPAGLAVATVLLWSGIYSPQYALWILPFFALARLSRRVFGLLMIADVAVFVTVYPLTLAERTADDPVQAALAAGLAAAVVLRHAALILTMRELWLRARPGAATIP